MAAVSAARKAAFDILLAIERGHGHSDDLLRGPAVNALAPADRNLVTALVLGTLRWQIGLDRQIRPLLKRPNAKLDAEILIVLRLGAFQLLHLNRIPAHAAIDESVELAKRAGQRYASGMVNAVLRKLAASEHDALADGESSNAEPILNRHRTDSLSGHDFSRAENAGIKERALAPVETSEGGGGFNPRVSQAKSQRALAPEDHLPPAPEIVAHPAWLVERWRQYYGAEQACALCRHGQSQPNLSIRIADPTAEAELLAAGIQLAPGELLSAARTVLAGDVTATPTFREGRVRIQDEGSQLVAEIAASLNQGPEKILDACAAPGGKTLILAERHAEARIVACESSAPRLAQLKKRLSGFADRIEFRLADAVALAEDFVFDVALVDVPCSGTGTLGRNPEIRHRLRAEDLPRQAERQRAILIAALRAVRPGGRVVYSTCSLEPEENEQVVAAVLAESGNARQISPVPQIEQMRRSAILTEAGAEQLAKCIAPGGALRLLPGALGTDGFFVALIEKNP